MNTTIVYNLKSGNGVMESLKDNRGFHHVETLKEAYIYHIEHVNVDSYIIDPTGMTSEQLKSIIGHIQYLNAIITIILYRPAFEIPAELKNELNIKIITTVDEITLYLKQISKVHRDANRVQWPLNVDYWIPHNKKGSLKNAKVLSLSASGCFVKTDPLLPLEKGDALSMIFSFKDFDFYSDGMVVRISGDKDSLRGIAVEFREVSRQTQKCIGEIIDEKILSQIMDALK